MRSTSLLASVLVLVSACGPDVDEPAGEAPIWGSLHSTTRKQGIATYYDATGRGSCSFDASPDDLDVVALNLAEYGGSASCGACLRISGEAGDITVRVVDSCPSCDAGHLDLSREAFAKLAPLKKGRVPITYRTVPCDVKGSIAYHFKDGSSKWWTAIQIRNHRVPVKKVEYRRGSTYVEMVRANYNYFVAENGVGDQPTGLGLRVTAADGQELEEELPGTIPSDESVSGDEQFN